MYLLLINPKEANTSEDTQDKIEISSDILRKYHKAIHHKPDDYKKWVR